MLLLLLTTFRFQWVRCQIDYLGSLPNDRERRSALGKLPPNLPETYIRVLERLDSKYPPETQLYIQRILKWLVLSSESTLYVEELSLLALAHAISIEKDCTRLDQEAVPDELEICGWCSSLTQRDTQTGYLTLSHFTVKEFLLCGGSFVPRNSTARKYLVSGAEDYNCLVHTCLTYQSLNDLSSVQLDPYDSKEIKKLNDDFPFFGHCTTGLPEYLKRYAFHDEEQLRFRRYFALETRQCLRYGTKCLLRSALSTSKAKGYSGPLPQPASIQTAASLLLVQTVKRLLCEGSDPNSPVGLCERPLHCAILSTHYPSAQGLNFEGIVDGLAIEASVNARRMQVVKDLISHGADIHATMEEFGAGPTSPLLLALKCERPEIFTMLIENGSKLTPTPDGLGTNYRALASCRYYIRGPVREELLSQILKRWINLTQRS